MDSPPSFQRPEVAAYVEPGVRRLLDVGCNAGKFGAAVASRGIEVWGIEPQEDIAAIARSKLARVIVGHYPTDMPLGETFDCIVLNDVLEHMPDPHAALIAAKSHLNPDGYLIASIPNVRHLSVITALAWRGRWDYKDWGILDRTHLRFFTKATMRELFDGAGYTVQHQDPNFWGEPTGGAARILKLAGRRRNEEFFAVQYVVVARPTIDAR